MKVSIAPPHFGQSRDSPLSDGAAFLIIKAPADDKDNIDDMPDDKSTTGQELNDTGDYFPGINAVNSSKTTENEEGKQQCNKT